jgi:hypothetical protein
MDHQEILPNQKRADTIAQVADESQENLQNEGFKCGTIWHSSTAIR